MSRSDYNYDNTSLTSLIDGLNSFMSYRDTQDASIYYTYMAAKFCGLCPSKRDQYDRYVANKAASVLRKGTPIEQTFDSRKYVANIETQKVDTYSELVRDYANHYQASYGIKRPVGGTGGKTPNLFSSSSITFSGMGSATDWRDTANN